MCTPTHSITAPFSPLDMHPHSSHLASPQTPLPALMPFLVPYELKRARPASPPFTKRPPQDAMRTDGASAEPLEAHDVTERERRRNQDSGMTPATHPRSNTQKRHPQGVLRPDDAAKPTKMHDARRREPVNKPKNCRRRKREAYFLRFYEPFNKPKPPANHKATTTLTTPTQTYPNAIPDATGDFLFFGTSLPQQKGAGWGRGAQQQQQ